MDQKPLAVAAAEHRQRGRGGAEHRQRLLVHAARLLDVQDVIRDWLGEIEWSPKVRVSVDVDPYSFL